MTPIHINPKHLQELIRYEPDTGKMFWKERDEKYFRTPTSAFIWNADKPGREIATKPTPLGYKAVTLFSKTFPAHRVAWAIHYGKWPSAALDHINGQPTDNRICNLREASNTLNQRNRVMAANNTSGYTGVRRTFDGRWSAHILKQNLGTFDTFEEAVEARKAAQGATPGFTRRHGLPRIGYVDVRWSRRAKKNYTVILTHPPIQKPDTL